MSFENSIRRKSIATRDTAFRSMQHENSLMANGSRSEFNKTHRSRERLPNYSIKAKNVHLLRPFFSSQSKHSTNGTELSDNRIGTQEEVVYDSEGSERAEDDGVSKFLIGPKGA